MQHAEVTASTTQDYLVADISLAELGRKEIAIAEHEMPGLMAIRENSPLLNLSKTSELRVHFT